MAFVWMRRSLLAAACASAALLAACGSSTVESAITPQRVVVFGDAVADTGQKGSAYTVNATDGSLLNWTTQFASNWGLSAKPVSQGGLNYAQGNARINATPDAAGNASTPTVTAQIDSFLASQKFGNAEFVLVSAGTADLIAGMAAVQAGQLSSADYQKQARQWGEALAAQVIRMINAGAQHVVISGVYNLSKTPWATTIGQTSLLDAASTAFNTGLKIALRDYGKQVQYVDLELYVNAYVNAPGSYGFDNASVPVCNSVDAGNGIGIGTYQVNSALCTPSTLLAGADYNRYVFADAVYLTPNAQRQFGTYAVSMVRNRW